MVFMAGTQAYKGHGSLLERTVHLEQLLLKAFHITIKYRLHKCPRGICLSQCSKCFVNALLELTTPRLEMLAPSVLPPQ